MDTLTELVQRLGYRAMLAAIGDILTQDPKVGMLRAPELSLAAGIAAGIAVDVDAHQ